VSVLSATEAAEDDEEYGKDGPDDRASVKQSQEHKTSDVRNAKSRNRIPVVVDEDAVRAARSLLDHIAAVAGIESNPTLADVMSFSEVLVKRENGDDLATLVPVVKDAVKQAVVDLVAARRREGAVLEIDLLRRCDAISRVLNEIEKRAPGRLAKELERLRNRIRDVVGDTTSDTLGSSRMEQEVALLADRVDITEEVVRLRSHVQMFKMAFLGVSEPIGQRLVFVLQEMNRESTTIASKANDTAISQMAVLIRQDIEKIREQVQNLC
jgi:uncharacterized protein (TIGR00255 family)